MNRLRVDQQQLAERIDHSLAVNAKLLCSGIFVVGRDAKDMIENDLTQDQQEERFDFSDVDVTVDHQNGRVSLTTPDGYSRTAIYHPGQGCTILPRGQGKVFFTPVPVSPDLPDADTTPWPMGDVIGRQSQISHINIEAVDAILDKAFDDSQWPEPQKTRGMVVLHKGEIIAERYARGFDKDTRQICWSTGKSITAALIGILIKEGCFTVDDYAPIEEWKNLDDPRRMIRIRHLLNMSSGLRFRRSGDGDPDEISQTSLDDHKRVYTDSINVFDHSINQPLEFTPGTFWRYRNCDPLTLGAIVRRTVEARGEEYLTFPQRALFDKIGMRSMVLEPDAWGNFIMTGFEYGTPRDWARFALLHLWDGVWKATGERIFPEGWVETITRPAPADYSHGYGGQLWVNAGGAWPDVPRDAYWPAGAMGQLPVVIPSHDAVIVRMGHSLSDQLPAYMNSVVSDLLHEIPER